MLEMSVLCPSYYLTNSALFILDRFTSSKLFSLGSSKGDDLVLLQNAMQYLKTIWVVSVVKLEVFYFRKIRQLHTTEIDPPCEKHRSYLSQFVDALLAKSHVLFELFSSSDSINLMPSELKESSSNEDSTSPDRYNSIYVMTILIPL